MLALGLPDIGDPLTWALRAAVELLGHFLDGARSDTTHVLDHFLFSTVDPSTTSNRPFTENPGLRTLNTTFTAAADILLTAVVVFVSLRGMLEHSLRARYTFRIMLPRLLMAVVLVHSSLLLIQMAIDLNNALGRVALSVGTQLDSNHLPWTASLSPSAVDEIKLGNDIFHAVFDVGLVIALVILVLAYVVRTSLLNVLVVTAPLAGLCTVLPDTRSYARTWLRLFLTTVFMQAVQLIVLRVATVTAFDTNAGVAQSIYALATLFIMLKVPGALNSAAHLETKAKTLGHRLERSLKRAMNQGGARRVMR